MEAYAGKQCVGIDLHRRRTVIVRTTEGGEVLEAVRIVNDVERLASVLARALPADQRHRLKVSSQVSGLKWMSRSVRRVLSSRTVAGRRATVIHLGYSLPSTSSGLPASSGGPPSNACCLTLLQVGFT